MNISSAIFCKQPRSIQSINSNTAIKVDNGQWGKVLYKSNIAGKGTHSIRNTHAPYCAEVNVQDTHSMVA